MDLSGKGNNGKISKCEIVGLSYDETKKLAFKYFFFKIFWIWSNKGSIVKFLIKKIFILLFDKVSIRFNYISYELNIFF